MADNESQPDPQDSEDDQGQPTLLRRRENRPVEVERRRNRSSGVDIGALLEMHLDQCKTRRAMIGLLEQWLTEVRSRPQEGQDPDYIDAIQRAIEVMKGSPDVETAIVRLQQRS
jgi:hypothetical protein